MFMLHKDAINHQKIISKGELLTLALLFLAVLVLLFPRQGLKEQILEEKSNYDLTSIYLHNLIRLEPENADLVLEMAKILYQQKKFHLAKNLLLALREDKTPKIQQEVSLLSLQINNVRLEKEKNIHKKALLLQENATLLSHIADVEYHDINKSKTLYYTALALKEKQTALKFNLNILSQCPRNEQLKWLKNLHYLAHDLNQTTIDKEALLELVKQDTHESILWLDALLSMDKKVILNAKELGLKGDNLAYFYLLTKQADKAIPLYLSLYKEAKNHVEKRAYLLKIIKQLRASNKAKEAATIVQAYEDDYLQESDTIKILLKLYLEAGRADLAKRLSLKLMQKKDIK